MHPIYKSFRIALFGIALNANLAGYTATVPNRFVSHSLVSSVQVSSVSKTLASGSVSPGKRLIASASGASSALNSGQGLAPNQSLTSPNGQYSLVCQSDRNLVLYDNSTSSAYWSSQTGGTAVNQCLMQSDGNLVVYGKSGAVWSSGTSGNSGAYLEVQDDRNVVIYAANGQVLWTTNTSVAAQRILKYANNYDYYGTFFSQDFQNAITNIVNQKAVINNIAFTPQGGWIIIYVINDTHLESHYYATYKNIPQEAVDKLNRLFSLPFGNGDIAFAPQGGFVITYNLDQKYISSDTPPALANEIEAAYNSLSATHSVEHILFPP